MTFTSFSPQQLAKTLGISRQAVTQQCIRGTINANKTNGKWVISLSDDDLQNLKSNLACKDSKVDTESTASSSTNNDVCAEKPVDATLHARLTELESVNSTVTAEKESLIKELKRADGQIEDSRKAKEELEKFFNQEQQKSMHMQQQLEKAHLLLEDPSRRDEDIKIEEKYETKAKISRKYWLLGIMAITLVLIGVSTALLVYIDEKSEKNINSIKISHDQELKDREYRISEAKKTAALLQEKADMVQNEAQKASLEAQQKIADITLAHTQETQKIALTAAQEAAVRAAEVASLQKELEMLKKSLISTPVGEVSIESIIPEASTEP